MTNFEAETQNKNRRAKNIRIRFSQWPFYVTLSKNQIRWHVSGCYTRKPENACAVCSIWNIAGGHSTATVWRWQT